MYQTIFKCVPSKKVLNRFFECRLAHICMVLLQCFLMTLVILWLFFMHNQLATFGSVVMSHQLFNDNFHDIKNRY